jgi:hypothetical protein
MEVHVKSLTYFVEELLEPPPEDPAVTEPPIAVRLSGVPFDAAPRAFRIPMDAELAVDANFTLTTAMTPEFRTD